MASLTTADVVGYARLFDISPNPLDGCLNVLSEILVLSDTASGTSGGEINSGGASRRL
jgi:hypothetical protein